MENSVEILMVILVKLNIVFTNQKMIKRLFILFTIFLKTDMVQTQLTKPKYWKNMECLH